MTSKGFNFIIAFIFTTRRCHVPSGSRGWYAIGLKGWDNTINWDAAELLEYLGDYSWCDEDGDPVFEVYDPILGEMVTPNSAEYLFDILTD